MGHPADTNADQRVELAELTAYISAWQQDLLWQGASIPAPFAEQATRLWQQGEHYRLQADAPEPFGWVPDPPDFEYVALHTQTAQPLEMLPIYGLPSDADNIEARFSVRGYAGEYIARVVRDDTGTPRLVVPINPFDLNGGGQLTFSFYTDNQRWLAGPVTLQEMAPAPQAIHTLRNSVREWLLGFAQSVGQDLPALLMQPLNQVPIGLLPAVALLHEIEGPQVSNNLDALLAGSAPALASDTLDLDLFERLAAKLELTEQLPAIPAPENATQAIYKASAAPTTRSTGHPDLIEIRDGLDLAEAMQQQKVADDTLQLLANGENLLEDLDSNLTEANNLLEKLKSVPGAALAEINEQQRQIRSVNKTSSYVGWFMRVVEFINHYNAGVLPSRFDGLTVSVQRAGGYTWIYEDDCSAAPVSALATASSRSVEYGADRSFLPDDLQQTILPDILPSFERDIPTGTVTFGPAGVSVAGEWVPSFTWPDIEVAIGTIDNTDSMIEVSILEPDLPFVGRPRSPQGSNQIIGSEVVPEVGAYIGITGTATVQVALKAAYFGGQSIQRTAPYQLRALDPLIFDYPQFITPGDPLSIRASLAAERQGLAEIEWQVRQANGQVIDSSVESMPTENTYLLELAETPEDNDAYPLQVVFRSVTKACLRASRNAPPRESEVSIKSAGFIIDPVPHCLAKGDEWIFFAVWPSGEPPENVSSVNWSISSGGGILTPEGPFSVRYTAPTSTGEVTLRAENTQDPDQFATASFNVGCAISSTLWFDGEVDFPPTTGTLIPEAIRLEYWNSQGAREQMIEAAGTLTIEQVTPVASHPGYSVAEGSFSAWGLALESNGLLYTPENYDQRVNDSGNFLEYAKPGLGDDFYTLGVTVTWLPLLPGNDLRLDPSGNMLEIDFQADGSVTNLSGGEVVSYQWNSSSGQSATGSAVTLAYPTQPGPAWVQVIATDTLGNTAQQLVYLDFVYVEAAFAFDYRDDGLPHVSFPFINPTLPGPVGSSSLAIEVVGEPLSGSATTGGSATISQRLEIEGNDGDKIPIFQIQYQPELN